MNITYILGNGFDIQCGLATRYSDFLKEYTVIQQGDNENIKDFKNYLSQSENQELWSDAEKAMGEHLQYFSTDNISKFTERIIDFESKLADYLETQQDRCSWDDTASIGKIFNDFLINSFSDIVSTRKDDLNFRFSLFNIKFITFNYTNILENLIEKYQIFLNSFWDASPFNGIYHVHGSLSSSIIMGVNDRGQILLRNGVKLTNQLERQIVKPVISRDIGHIWDGPAIRTIEKSDVIVIYGVSFGATDNIWWEAIRKWLKDDTSHKIVAFVKTKENQIDRRIAFQTLNYENEETPKILRKLGFPTIDTTWNRLSNQIFTIPNTTRLNLKPILLKKDLALKNLNRAAARTLNSGKGMI